MSGVVHDLSACITSALAIKPSTVYVLRVENTQTRDVWHIRRCFSEFCDLRERMLILIDGQGSQPATSGDDSGFNSPTPAAVAATRRLLSRNASFKSSRPGSSTNSPRSTSAAGTGRVQERFPYLYTKFPRRQFFGSRTKKVIEQRTMALNQFLQEALWFMREVKMQHNIAMYFSLMTQLEAFFDCGCHAPTTPMTAPVAVTTQETSPVHSTNQGLHPSYYHATARPKSHSVAPVLPYPQLAPFSSPEIDAATNEAAERARALAARGFLLPYALNDDESDEEADDYEERKVLKKTISCFMDHEVAERRLHYNQTTAGRFATMLQTRVSERDAVIPHPEKWAARIEIAGIPPAEALRRRNSQNQAVLLKQYSTPPATGWKTDPISSTIIFSVKDHAQHRRAECPS